MDELSNRANIKARLFAKGYSLRDVDREHGLPAHTTSKTLQLPYCAGEEAIAAVLGVENLSELWPDRYSPSGQRLSPFKYERPETLKQRRKHRAVLAASVFALLSILPMSSDRADAHDFYEPYCCSDTDCAPLDAGSVAATDNGWLIKSNGAVIPYASQRVKHSPDGRFHGCFRAGNPQAETICLYVPEQGS